ncbi:MAG TPA: oxygenase MpaB family protein [Pedobacter sp.]|jgi:hypothetical protein
MPVVPNYSNEFLNAKRLQGDPEPEEFIKLCFGDPHSRADLYNWLKQHDSPNHLPTSYLEHHFIANCRTLPVWADERLMKAGSAFFVKHAEQIMQLLGLLSLPYCYAAADGAMVLYLSRRLQDDSAKRLSDTANFIWEVMNPAAFDKDGKGFSICLKIRLTHAVARYYTLKSGQWDNSLGVPVNQEDMAGTNLAFSLIVIRGLRKLGYTISYEEQQSFMHLWNVIGFLLGLEEDLIPQDGKSATALEKSISTRHFKSSEQGRELTKYLISYFNTVTDKSISKDQTLSLMRYLLGEEVSALLNIPSVSIPSYLPPILKLSSNLPNLSSTTSVKLSYQQKYNAYKKQSLVKG